MRDTLPSPDDAIVKRHLASMRARGCSQGTIDARFYAVRQLRRALGVPLLEATPRQLEDWAATESLRVSISGWYNLLGHARNFYRWAVAAGLVDASPVAGLVPPRLPRRLPRPVSEPDLHEAVVHAPERIRPWLALAAAAGLRAREIAFLRREDILDTAEPPVIVVSSLAGKGRRERVVPLSPWLLAELRPYLPARGWVFRRRDDGDGPNRPWLVSNLSARYLRSVGVDASLHQLRHRFATVGLQQPGANLRVVQELLGHANPATTAIYTAVSPARAAAVVASMPPPA